MPATPISAESVISILVEHELLECAEPIHPDSDLFALGLDSLAMMQLLLHLESAWQVSLPVSEITRERFSTPKLLTEWLNQH